VDRTFYTAEQPADLLIGQDIGEALLRRQTNLFLTYHHTLGRDWPLFGFARRRATAADKRPAQPKNSKLKSIDKPAGVKLSVDGP